MIENEKVFKEELKGIKRKRELLEKKQWYDIRSLLGYNWAHYFILLGAREAGKTVSLQRYMYKDWKKGKCKNFWIRSSEAQTRKLLENNGDKAFDPIIRNEFNINGKVTTRSGTVFVDGKKFMEVLALSTAFNDKGSSIYDANFKGMINIIIDEFQFEKGQRRTYDILYNLGICLENLIRSRPDNVRIFFLGNATQECSEILSLFNFIPQTFGRFKLKSMMCVIDNIKPSDAYKARRSKSIVNVINGTTSNYTNVIETDISQVTKRRLNKPSFIIKFSKEHKDWFTVWDGLVIAPYNGEKKMSIAMFRHIDDKFIPENRDDIITQYDVRAFKYKNLLTQKRFQYQISLIKAQ